MIFVECRTLTILTFRTIMKVVTHLIFCSHLATHEFFPSRSVSHAGTGPRATREAFAARQLRKRRKHVAACGTLPFSPRNPTAAPQIPQKHLPRCSTPPMKPPNTSDLVSKYTIVFSTTVNKRNNQCHNVVIHPNE